MSGSCDKCGYGYGCPVYCDACRLKKHPKGRAANDAAKGDVANQLLTAWKRQPHQRCGQFIANALRAVAWNTGRERDQILFTIEDYELLRAIKEYVGDD